MFDYDFLFMRWLIVFLLLFQRRSGTTAMVVVDNFLKSCLFPAVRRGTGKLQSASVVRKSPRIKYIRIPREEQYGRDVWYVQYLYYTK